MRLEIWNTVPSEAAGTRDHLHIDKHPSLRSLRKRDDMALSFIDIQWKHEL